MAIIWKDLEDVDKKKIQNVCRRWKRSYDWFEDEHPCYHPISNTIEKFGQIVGYGWYTRPRMNDTVVRTCLDIKLMELEVCSHYSFATALRGLEVLPLDNLGAYDEQFWKEASRFLKKFGTHVTCIVIGIAYRNELKKYLKVLVDILNCMPNLRYLKFVSEPYDNDEIDCFCETLLVEKYVSKLEDFKSLQSLVYDNDTKIYEFYRLFLGKVYGNLRMIQIGMWVMNDGICKNLVHVTDLVISNVYSVVQLGKILTNLRWRLSRSNNDDINVVLMSLYVQCSYKVKSRDIFALVDESRIENFDVRFDVVEEDDMYDFTVGPPIRILSVVSLTIDDTDQLHYYNFLSWLPNLKYLTLRGKGSWQVSLNKHENCKFERTDLSIILKEALYESKPPSVIFWKTVPKLQILTVIKNDFFILTDPVYFFRATSV